MFLSKLFITGNGKCGLNNGDEDDARDDDDNDGDGDGDGDDDDDDEANGDSIFN